MPDPVALGGEQAGDVAAGGRRARWISSARASSACQRPGQHRPAAQLRQVCCSRCTQLRSARALRRRRSATSGLLGGGVGHDPLGGIGRRGRAQVGDQIAQRVVRLVADRADHRCGARGDRPAQRLVGERQQVLDAAAAAGQDDDVDVRVGVQRRAAPRRSGRRRWVPARRCCAPRTAPRASGRSRPTITSCSAADARPVISPMVFGQERDRPFQPRVEQPLGVEQPAQPLDAGQQFADPDRADLADPQRERAAAGVEAAACRSTITWVPSVESHRGVDTRSRGQVSDSDMSAAGSRSTMNAVESGRTLSWAI